MKRKLIAIALIALLVLTVAPAAAAAQPKMPQRSTVIVPVYFGKFDETNGVWVLSKYSVGIISMNFDTGRWWFAGVLLLRGEYSLCITSLNTQFPPAIGIGSVTSHGLGLTWGTGSMSSYVKYAYDYGGSVFISKY